MRAEKQKRLEAKGWKVGGPKELLNLSEEEARVIETRVKQGERLKKPRKR